MRGLSNRPGRACKAVITAVAGSAALGLFVAACATGGTGTRDEGPAGSARRAGGGATPSASPTGGRPSVAEVVALVKADAKVSKAVKRDLEPCVADEYPVDVSYGNLTGGTGNDIVVNVMTCGDAVGMGTYVYRERGGEYRNVFRAEEPPVYAEIDRGDLVVTQQLYEKDDPVSYPSSEEVITYRWTAERFAEQSRTHNDYSNAVGTADSPAPAAD
ncbi:lipoprotein CseA [Streptomyces ruber]|uniref:Lipoprotein CseA n=2 Tax=Streptomyces TaxID=1883 RepID=A0A918BRR7_9ACTN|nr:hypothetical protein [Streptomyces ruber]GGQ88225.1 lipoprotein CseA [Streptomyces ruber]